MPSICILLSFRPCVGADAHVLSLPVLKMRPDLCVPLKIIDWLNERCSFFQKAFCTKKPAALQSFEDLYLLSFLMDRCDLQLGSCFAWNFSSEVQPQNDMLTTSGAVLIHSGI